MAAGSRMACSSPTMRTSASAGRSTAGWSELSIHFMEYRSSRSGRGKARALEPVVDRLAEALGGTCHHGDASRRRPRRARAMRKQFRRGFDEIAARRQIERGAGEAGAGPKARSASPRAASSHRGEARPPAHSARQACRASRRIVCRLASCQRAEHSLDLFTRKRPRAEKGRLSRPTTRWSNSTPTVHGPPSRIRSMRPRKSASTWAAVVGETWPERLAVGATMGPPNFEQIARDRIAGKRTATVSRPARPDRRRRNRLLAAAPASEAPARSVRKLSRGGVDRREASRLRQSSDMSDQRIEAGRPLAA